MSDISNRIRNYHHIYKFEEEVLKFSGLTLHKDLLIKDVPIDYKGSNYIHTIEAGSSNTEVLTLLHGYGGSSTLYYMMLKDLAQHQRVLAVDFLGMGLSSRAAYDATNTEESIDYFVESIEKWRQSMGIERFNLGGHSFGGYMAAHYTLKYPERVNKLLMISPVGVTNMPENLDKEDMRKRWPFFARFLFDEYMKFWDEKKTLAGMMKTSPFIVSYVLKKFVSKRFRLPEAHSEALYKYLEGVLKMPAASEAALHHILKPIRITAQKPLEDVLMKKLNTPTSFYYGNFDWMEPSGAYRLANNKSNVKFNIIEKAGHQMIVENPQELVKQMVRDIRTM